MALTGAMLMALPTSLAALSFTSGPAFCTSYLRSSFSGAGVTFGLLDKPRLGVPDDDGMLFTGSVIVEWLAVCLSSLTLLVVLATWSTSYYQYVTKVFYILHIYLYFLPFMYVQ